MRSSGRSGRAQHGHHRFSTALSQRPAPRSTAATRRASALVITRISVREHEAANARHASHKPSPGPCSSRRSTMSRGVRARTLDARGRARQAGQLSAGAALGAAHNRRPRECRRHLAYLSQGSRQLRRRGRHAQRFAGGLLKQPLYDAEEVRGVHRLLAAIRALRRSKLGSLIASVGPVLSIEDRDF
jgi:hypothetical protein